MLKSKQQFLWEEMSCVNVKFDNLSSIILVFVVGQSIVSVAESAASAVTFRRIMDFVNRYFVELWNIY